MNKTGTQAVWTNTELMGTGSSTEWGTQTENVVQCGTFLHQGHADFGSLLNQESFLSLYEKAGGEMFISLWQQ